MSLRVIFMGTPEFAVPSLDILVENGVNVVAVVTATDKMGGRNKKKEIISAVKEYATSKGIPVLQPRNLKSEEFLEELRSYQADLQIVVAFRMLPVVVWDMPKLGTWNLHGSLLPKYRGAAPINWAIINGEKETGVTTFKLQHQIDTGKTLLQAKEPISEADTVGDVYARLMKLGAKTLYDTYLLIESGNYELIDQDNSLVCHAPKLNKENTQVNWTESAKSSYDLVRGLNPYPLAWAMIAGQRYQLGQVSITDKSSSNVDSGDLFFSDKNSLWVATADYYLSIETLKPSGKKMMDIKSFMNGVGRNLKNLNK